MTKYRPGSAGAAEEKQNKLLLIVFGVITLLVLGLQFVFNTDIKTSVMDATLTARIIGGITVASSWLPIYFGLKTPDDTKRYAMVWAILAALGILISIQFGDTPHDYKMH